ALQPVTKRVARRSRRKPHGEPPSPIARDRCKIVFIFERCNESLSAIVTESGRPASRGPRGSFLASQFATQECFLRERTFNTITRKSGGFLAQATGRGGVLYKI